MHDSVASTIWEFVVYPDSESYDCQAVLDKLMNDDHFGHVAYALHDADIRIDPDSGEAISKKAHYHVMTQGKKLESGQYTNTRLTTLQYLYPELQIQKGKTSYRAMVRYLIHADSRNKAQYPVSAITSNFPHESFFRDKDKESSGRQISRFIVETDCQSFAALDEFVHEHNLYHEYIKGFSVWRELIRENRKFGGAF